MKSKTQMINFIKNYIKNNHINGNNGNRKVTTADLTFYIYKKDYKINEATDYKDLDNDNIIIYAEMFNIEAFNNDMIYKFYNMISDLQYKDFKATTQEG